MVQSSKPPIDLEEATRPHHQGLAAIVFPQIHPRRARETKPTRASWLVSSWHLPHHGSSVDIPNRMVGIGSFSVGKKPGAQVHQTHQSSRSGAGGLEARVLQKRGQPPGRTADSWAGGRPRSVKTLTIQMGTNYTQMGSTPTHET